MTETRNAAINSVAKYWDKRKISVIDPFFCASRYNTVNNWYSGFLEDVSTDLELGDQNKNYYCFGLNSEVELQKNWATSQYAVLRSSVTYM